MARDIFKFRGVRGGNIDKRSHYFQKYFAAGNVDYLGRVMRRCNYNDKEVFNSSFGDFCRANDMKLPNGYRMVFRTLDAGFKSVSKYDRGQPQLDEGAWLLAGEWTKQHFMPVMGGSEVLDKEFVLSEMDKTTSCGYPWNLQFFNKTDFLADEKASKVLDDYWERIALPENEIVPIWTCSQKVELRTVEKLMLYKHRTFTASPIEHTVSSNRLFLDQNNGFYNSNGRTWSFVGISKFLSGWDCLFNRLNKHPNAFELDEKDFDASLFARALSGQAEIRWSFLDEKFQTAENRKRLEAIYRSIIHSVVVLENGELVQKHTGNPSGSNNTIVDNTMILFRLFAYAWIILCKELGREISYSEFMEEVEAALNGDDNTFTVSDAVVSWFNPTNIARVWSAIGVTTTTPNFNSRKLQEVTFLSQGFDYDVKLGCWLPVPETERVLSSLYAGANVDDVRWHLLRASALRLDSYGNKECRSILSRYITYLHKNYADKLVGSVKVVGSNAIIKMQDILNVWKSDAFIEALYCGLEGKDGDLKSADPSSNHFKNFYLEILNNNNLQLEFLTLQSLVTSVSNMPRTAAQKAARKRRRQAKKVVVKGAPPKTHTNRGKSTSIVVKGSGTYVPTRFQRTKGKGDYASTLGDIGRSIGGVGDLATSVFNAITGRGSYRERSAQHADVYKNKDIAAALASVTNPQSMNMGAMNVQFGGTVPRVTHREFIGPVFSSVDFNTTVYRIQPGLSGTSVLFPWGSSVAKCFEEYKLLGMILEYKSTSTNFSSTTTLGSVMMSTLYDAEEPPLATQLAINNHEFTTSDTPCNSFIHPVECATSEQPISVRFVQSSNTPGTSSDIRFNDVGTFQVSTIGNSSTGIQIGELWASYNIEFLKPALPDIHSGTSFWASGTSAGGIQKNFGGGLLYNQNNSYPVTITQTGTNIGLQLPVGYAGTYQLTLQVVCPIAQGFNPICVPHLVGSDITINNVWASSSATNSFGAIDGGASAYIGQMAEFQTPFPGGVLTEGGFILVIEYTTIAETLVNNVLNITSSLSVDASVSVIHIDAVDNDMVSGTYESTPPNPTSFKKRRFGEIVAADSIKINNLEQKYDSLLKLCSGMADALKNNVPSVSLGSRPVTLSSDKDASEIGDLRADLANMRAMLDAMDVNPDRGIYDVVGRKKCSDSEDYADENKACDNDDMGVMIKSRGIKSRNHFKASAGA